MIDRDKWLQEKLERIRSFSRYVKPKTPYDVTEETGIDCNKVVKLNQNENVFLSREFLSSLLDEIKDGVDLRVYTKEGEEQLKEVLGQYTGLTSDHIILGCGSDQIIDLIVRTFLNREDIALSIKPTYSMYRWAVNHIGVRYVEVLLKEDFSLNVDGILNTSNSSTKLCFVCSPNNPTGNQFEIEDMKALIENFPGLVLVDEAYVEYGRYSLASSLREYNNLIIMRTLSKAFGLAGARIGYALSNPEISSAISESAQLPYALGCLSLKLALKAFEKIHVFMESVARLKDERESLIGKLSKIKGIKPFRSDTNFILFTAKFYEEVFDQLAKNGILVRKIGNILDLGGCLRTTIGLPSMNEKLVEALISINR